MNFTLDKKCIIQPLVGPQKSGLTSEVTRNMLDDLYEIKTDTPAPASRPNPAAHPKHLLRSILL